MSTVRRRLLLAATLAASTLAPREAGAGGDSMASTRGGEMFEREHRIDLRFEPGYATLVVRRTVHNPSQRPDEASYGLLVPDQAVATRLRIRAGKSRWYTGELLATQVAADRYHALTGMDPTRHPAARSPKDPALLAWEAPDELSLHVFPVDAGRDRTVEYTLEMPAAWIDGRWHIDLPDTGLEDLPADLSLRTDAGRLYVDDRVVASGHRVRLDEPHTIALAPRERPVAALELASLPTGQDRAYVHWRLSLARHLAPIPRDLRVVIALDFSRSLPTAVDVAQRRAAMAYLEHLRQPHLGARVQLLGFDRRVRPLSRGWVSAARAIELLRNTKPELNNGSDIELALRTAGKLLASQPATSPKRVLLLTDFHTASSQPPAAHTAAATATGALVHLATVRDDNPRLARDDEHPWADVAASTRGVVWRAAAVADPEPEEHDEAIALFEEWVRPLRIDDLHVDLGQPYPEDPTPDTLAGGEAVTDLLLLPQVVDTLTVRGRTWNTPFVRTAQRDPALSRRWSALIFGSHLHDDLDEHEQLRLALHGGAVSPQTSYLAVEPGAAPTRDGIVRGPPGNTGLIGRGGGGGTGTGYGRSTSTGFSGRLDRQTWLEDQLDSFRQNCRSTDALTITLETTYDEIVDITTTQPPAPAALITCIREATWSLLLPTGDFTDPRARWTIKLPPA